MTEKTIQQIIDHWHIGRLRSCSKSKEHYALRTDHGDYLLFPLYDPKQANTQDVARRREEILSVLYRHGEQGEEYQIMQCGDNPRLTVAHINDCHYALYRLKQNKSPSAFP